MEVDPTELTESFILSLTSAQRLNQVHELNVSSQNLVDLDATLLSSLTSLHSLDLSSNQLTHLPRYFSLPSLRSLDLSNNQLSSLEYLEGFPNLEQLNIQDNNLEEEDQYIALEYCPRLQDINGVSVSRITNYCKQVKSTLNQQLDDVWCTEYESSFPHGIPHTKVKDLIINLATKVSEKHNKIKLPVHVQGFLLSKLATDMVFAISGGLYESPRKTAALKESNILNSPRKKKVPLTPTKKTNLSNKPQLCSPQKNNCPSSSTKFSSPNKSFTTLKSPTKSPVKRPRVAVTKTSPAKKQKVGCVNLAPVSDYDPVHFVRCHFGDREAKKQGCINNDPKDEFTKIWHCTFEPHPREEGGETGIVATCGGDMVCLLDCSTGRVIKRYRQEGQQFYTLAWTTLSIEVSHGKEVAHRPTNILAVGGYDGHLCLLHPDQFMCYKEWGSGRPNKGVPTGAFYVSSLIFHPHSPIWLFSGTSDQTVTLWDIGVPSGSKHVTDIKSLAIFNCRYEILNLVISEVKMTGYLVAGCDEMIVVWKLPQPDDNMKKTGRRQPVAEIEPPLDAGVDGLTLLSQDILACKCVEDSCIYVWSLKETLSYVEHGVVEMIPLMTLEWKYTQHSYIQLTARNGVIACGDDEGNLWLYNVKNLIKKKAQQLSTEIYKPSRILLWPDCNLNKHNKNDQLMADILDKPASTVNAKPLIINSVCLSSTGEYLVAGTDNNLVCVWKESAN